MRPIRLELENFTVYRGRHSLDLSPLNFFVIKGRTGSGKTSLIDAICYALYGKVPRYGGEKAHSHLLSKGQRYMRVSFEFSVRGRRYKIEREYELGKKGGQSDFRFYEEGRPKAFKEVNLRKYIEDILRLDYNTFTKVILLPQNQFDRFLKPQEQRERREILNSLLGFSGLFSALKDIIGEEYKGLRSQTQAIELRLQGLSHVSPDLILQKEKDLKELDSQYQSLVEERAKTEALLAQCKERDALLEEKNRLMDSLRILSTKEEEIKHKKSILERALEILPYLPKVEQYQRIISEEETLTRERQRKELELKKYSEERKNAEEEFEKREREFKNLEEYNQKRLELAKTLQVLEDYLSQMEAINRLQKDIQELERTRLLQSKSLQELRERSIRGFEETRKVREAIRALEERGVEQEFILAQELKRQIQRLKDLEKEEERLRGELKDYQTRLELKRQELERSTGEMESLSQNIGELESQLESLRPFTEKEAELIQEELRLRDLHSKALELEKLRQERASHREKLQEMEASLRTVEERLGELSKRRFELYSFEIRAGLKEGDLCPVCGQRVGHLIVEEGQEDLHELLKEQEALESQREALRAELSRVQAYLSTLEGRERELEGALGGLTREEIELRLSELKTTLEDLRNKKKLLREKEQELAELRKKQSELSKVIQKLSSEEASLREGLSSKLSLLERLEGEKASLLASLGEDIDAVLEKIKRIEEDYEELRLLREKERKYTQRLEDIQRELSEAERKFAETEERLKALEEQRHSKEEKAHQLKDKILEATGEGPSKALLNSLRSRMEALERRVKEIQEEYGKANAYLQKIRAEETRLVVDIQNIEKFLSSLQKQKESIAENIYQLQVRFGSLEDLKTYALSQEQIRILQQEIEEYHRESHVLKNRLEDTESKLQSLKDLPETSEIEERLKALDASLHENRELYGSLQKELESLRQDLSERQSLEEKLSELGSQLSLYERLRNDLTDNQFPEFVSQLMLQRITERASYYLFKFTSGQFTFELLEGDLHVHDHSTGHNRVVSSLSGGETFLASLSLAFAVADMLSQNAPLESLFIDEGFGSLDRETRESLSEFFDLIRQSTDRLVGIITHVEDIAEKFSQRIEVEKSGGSARIRVIY